MEIYFLSFNFYGHVIIQKYNKDSNIFDPIRTLNSVLLLTLLNSVDHPPFQMSNLPKINRQYLIKYKLLSLRPIHIRSFSSNHHIIPLLSRLYWLKASERITYMSSFYIRSFFRVLLCCLVRNKLIDWLIDKVSLFRHTTCYGSNIAN